MQPVIKDQSSKHDKVPSGSKRVGRANESNKANKLLTTGKALALLSMLEELLLLVTGFLQSATKPDLGLGSRCHFIRTASCLGLVMQPALRQHHCACLGSTLEDPDSQTRCLEDSSICSFKSVLHAFSTAPAENHCIRGSELELGQAKSLSNN